MLKKVTCIIIFLFITFANNLFAKEVTAKEINVKETVAKEIRNKFFRHISYVDVGEGDSLILIHAFPTDQRLWLLQLETLKKYFRVVSLDLWGFGKSTNTDGKAVKMTDYADEVKELLDQLHITKAIIGGESMGGYIALAFLQQYPERIQGIILSDTQSIADTEEVKQKRELTAQSILVQGSNQFINDFISKALSTEASTEMRQQLKSMLQSQEVEGMASALRGMALRRDTSYLLQMTTLPVLIITGDKDLLISPKQSENMHALAKNSQLAVIKNAGHLSNLEQSIEWNKAVINMFYRARL